MSKSQQSLNLYGPVVIIFILLHVTVLAEQDIPFNPTMGCIKRLNIPASELFSRKYNRRVVEFHQCLLRDGGYMDDRGVLDKDKIKNAIHYNDKSDSARSNIDKCLNIEHDNIAMKATKVNQCLTPL
ncbi:PBP/GOBP family [Popillia japonica]|uniref:PBP/GOBP family n=1 Tax=Popillia japonica TaxID=7064 RepID=A0AAW1I9F8_POPJA